jgi:catechol 2,3-dioxygenase-like lactoylglutathione lyase family enzyme
MRNVSSKRRKIGETVMKISLVSLRVENPKELADWYTRHLGLTVIQKREETGTTLLGTDEEGTRLIFLKGPPPQQPEQVQLHFQVPDVDKLYERLKAQGVRFDEPPEDMPWGWRHAYTRDPAGHTVEIVTPLPGAKFR